VPGSGPVAGEVRAAGGSGAARRLRDRVPGRARAPARAGAVDVPSDPVVRL